MLNLAHDNRYWGSTKPCRSEVLILDDSQFDRKRIRRALSKLTSAPNVTEIADLVGLDGALNAKRFDVILVDYALADGDGLQALAKIKLNRLSQNARVVMVTGNDSSSLAVNAMKLGFDDYVTKDDLDADLLSKLLLPVSDNTPASVIPFPSQRIQKGQSSQFDSPNPLGPSPLEQSLQAAINAAIDTAMARVCMDEMADNVVDLVASLTEEDEFVFRELR